MYFRFTAHLLVAIVVLTGFTTLLLIYPMAPLSTFFSLEPVTYTTQQFRYSLLMFPAVNIVISAVLEVN